MPLTHTRTFRVRFYECDAFGHVSNAVYLQYMAEAAGDASAAAGYSRKQYREMERVWLIRDTDIRYRAPLVYGDSVEVKTWVMDFRRVRSRRAYEMRRAGTGEVVAEAVTDWAFLEAKTGRPAPIPDDMINAFFQGGPPEHVPPRERFPASPPPPPNVFTIRRRVEWRDIDPNGHVNNGTYVTYMDNVAYEHARVRGWPVERYLREGAGVVIGRRRIEYLQPAVMDEELDLSTWISNMRRVSGVRHFAIRRATDGELLARGNARIGYVDLSSGKPAQMPEAWAVDFEEDIVD